MHRGEPVRISIGIDFFPDGANLLDEPVQVVFERQGLVFFDGGKPVHQVDHAVHIGTDNVDRPFQKIQGLQPVLDVFGPYPSIALLADDIYERWLQVNYQSVLPGGDFILDKFTEMENQ